MSARRFFAMLGIAVTLVCAAGLACAPPAQADNIYVETTGSDVTGVGSLAAPYASIGMGLSSAAFGDTVWVGLGSYEGTVTLVSGVRLIGSGASASSIVATAGVIANGITNCEVRGFTITGGNSFGGGGIECWYSDIALANLRITGNSALIGGGLFAAESTVTASACEIANCWAGGGGAAYLTTSTATFDGCYLTANTSSMSGALTSAGSSLAMTDCLIAHNTSGWAAGGLMVARGTAYLERCDISHNSGGLQGGGIAINVADVKLVDCTVNGNNAMGGAGAYCTTSTVEFDGGSVGGNSASMSGGGISAFDTDLSLSGVSVTENGATWQSGGINLARGTLDIRESVIESNTGGLGGGGIFARECTATVVDTAIDDNHAMVGAGFQVTESDTTLDGATFSGNHASFEISALGTSYGVTRMTDCVFDSNSSTFGVGAVSLAWESCTVADTSFTGNSAGISIGALSVRESDLAVADSTFESNTALWNAVSGCSTSTVDFDRCTFKDNSSTAWASVYGANASTITATNCLFSGNSSSGGPVVVSGSGSYDYVNCTIADNTVGPLSAAMEGTVTAPVAVTNSVLWGNGGIDTTQCVVTYSDTEQGVAGVGNISTDPTFEGAGDYRLAGGSSCIDTASPAAAPAVDLLGNSRPQDGNGDGTALPDMGAYEFEACVATPDAYTTPEDQVLLVFPPGVLANDVWPDPLTAALVTPASHGTATVSSNGTLVYAPAANFNGTDEFTYRVSDGYTTSLPTTVTIDVTPVNDRPTGSADTTTCAEDTVALIELLGNDSDIDGDPLTAKAASLCMYGSVEIDPSGVATYTPPANWSGTDTFYYRASDGDLDSNMIEVTVVVTPVNDAPVAVDDATSCDEDGATAINILANDTDTEDDSLTATLTAGTSHGALTFNTDGSILYRPSANWFGTDTFTYQAYDGAACSNTATCTITVNSVNDPPVALGETYAAVEDTSLVVPAPGVLSNETDVEGDPLSAEVTIDPAHGTVSLHESGGFLYVPEDDFNGTDSFTYRAYDGAAYSAPVVATINVANVQDAPAAIDDSYEIAEDTTLSVAADGILGNDTDADGDTLTTALVDDTDHGLLTLNADGSLTYLPDTDYYGDDFFTYRADDGTETSGLARVAITVTPVNDAPVAVAESYTVTQDTTLTVDAPGVLGNDTDVEDDPLTAVESTATTPHGVLALAADGSFTYRPTAGFVGADSFEYIASDGTTDSAPAQVDINVTDTTPPVTTSNAVASYNDLAVITLSATDNASGVAATHFVLDGGATQTGTSVTCEVLGTHTLVYWSVDGVGNTEAHKTKTFKIIPAETDYTQRAGTTRYETAVQISRKAFPDGADAVIIATGEEWPDALGAAALAGAKNAPILLTQGHSLPASVRAEIERLEADSAIVVGGVNAIDAGVFSEIAKIVGAADTTRIGGNDRHATSRLLAQAAVAELGDDYDGTCFVTTPETFPDALAAGPLSAARGWPVYLSDGNDVPLATLSTMRSTGANNILILGGEAAVLPPAEWRLETTFGQDHVRRLFGGTRYRTAVEVARYGVEHAGLAWDGMAIATGEEFPDALTGGVLQAKAGSVLTLTPTDKLDKDLAIALKAERDVIGHVVYLGGTNAVSTNVRFQVAQILR